MSDDENGKDYQGFKGFKKNMTDDENDIKEYIDMMDIIISDLKDMSKELRTVREKLMEFDKKQ